MGGKWETQRYYILFILTRRVIFFSALSESRWLRIWKLLELLCDPKSLSVDPKCYYHGRPPTQNLDMIVSNKSKTDEGEVPCAFQKKHVKKLEFGRESVDVFILGLWVAELQHLFVNQLPSCHMF